MYYIYAFSRLLLLYLYEINQKQNSMKEDEDYFEEGNTGEFHEVDEEYLYYNGAPDQRDRTGRDYYEDEHYYYEDDEEDNESEEYYYDDEEEDSSDKWCFMIVVFCFIYWLCS